MKSALVIITEGSEDLECVTVMDVLRRAGIQVTVASASQDTTVHCANGTKVLADVALSSVKDNEFDALVLPGGGKAAETYSSVLASFSALVYMPLYIGLSCSVSYQEVRSCRQGRCRHLCLDLGNSFCCRFQRQKSHFIPRPSIKGR
jgi:hypothetical protein